MRSVWAAACMSFILVACGGGGHSLEEFAVQSEGLVKVLMAQLDTLDAEWESQAPTLEGAQTYWERRLQARVEFLEGIQALDPPEQVVDLHETALDIFSRVNAAEQALAARVVTLDFEGVTDHGPWWDTPEGRAARAVDAEGIAICHAAQGQFDATQESEMFSDMAWLPSELSEVVQVAFPCPP